MKRVDALLADYGSYHRARGNLICHSFGIPLIVFGILTFLQRVSLSRSGWTAAEVVAAAALLFYAALDVPLALAMLLPLGALDLASRLPGSWKAGLAAFFVGWIFQGIGHARYEGNSPAFLRNLVHLMIGPLFLVNELFRLRPGPAGANPARTAEK
ncbi:MAG: Mpo1-like protein [Acidobacteriota bacterium]